MDRYSYETPFDADGDRVRVLANTQLSVARWGVGTIEAGNGDQAAYIDREGAVGIIEALSGLVEKYDTWTAEHETEEAAKAIAARKETLRKAGLAIVADEPGTYADGSGYVVARFHGAAVKVLGPAFHRGPDDWELTECLEVELVDNPGLTQSVHVNSLTPAQPVTRIVPLEA